MSVIKSIQRWDSANRQRASARLVQDFDIPAAEKFVRWYDHGLFRIPWSNFAQVGPNFFRSNYPTPQRLRKMRALGIKTVLSLRGKDCEVPYLLEQWACKDLGLTLQVVKLDSIRPPKKAELLKLMQILRAEKQPLLVHCKSGADRTGLASAFYQIEILGLPISFAKKMLSIRFGHFRMSKTGVLDHILESYEQAARKKPQTIRQWLHTSYDEAHIRKEFKALRKKA
ncbi:dual specificity protein phosphatase family protein [Cognatishimia sp. WU-CL00825]|uniref:tyrosine-protein phosphatase n=1 Tax=Cognatishimia sp. WU-CL00825 TaxID=3127658 RepID=UPI003106883C